MKYSLCILLLFTSVFLAAYSYGREFIGIDNNQDYLDLSIKRFGELKANLKKKKAIERSRRIEDYR